MSLMTELLDYVEANTSLTESTDLFYGKMPRDIEVGVCLTEAGGSENDTNMYRKLFQILAVFTDPVTAEAKCSEVYELLVYNNGLQLPSHYVFNCTPMAVPQYLHLTKDNYFAYVASFVLYTER